jgi:1-acyl-sn-glycerol-3-phosphate acyltransferase
MVIYPEGHRFFKAEKAAPLKKGMIQYAYERGHDCQIIICFG